MPARKKVLITGGAGRIGRILGKVHAARYDITSYDLKESPDVRSIVGNLTDIAALEKAFDGQDAVVHMAADIRVESPWESALPNNIVGTYNVFEAAKRTGVKRVIFASSQHATGGFYLDEPYKSIVDGRFRDVPKNYQPIDETCPIRPDGYYGASKAFGEALGSYYKDYHGLSSLHLRIGWVITADDPTFSPFALSLWLSHRDAAQIVGLCIDAPPSLKYDVFYATSDNKWKIWSIEKAKKVLGYRPQDAAGEKWTPRPTPTADR
jgi:nucleoside-diphosphate-sugar epimerase